MPSCPDCKQHYEDGTATCAADGATLIPDAVAERIAKAEIAPGTMIGEYRVEAKIGEGGFGAVYRAIQPVIGKGVAIKLLSQSFSEDPQIVSRFIAEARAVNQIHHKNIVDIFSFGALPDGRQYFVMELLRGMPLDVHLHDKGQLEVSEMAPIIRAVLRALVAAHGAGIAHRDLKPENVFLVFDDEGNVAPKLIDFGIAKLLGEGESDHKTRTGTPIGTPYYMSPEQCRGKKVDHRTDLYSIGAMIHVLLTGRRPFTGDSPMDVLFKQMTEPPPKLSDHRPGLPQALEDLVLKLLEKDPDKRPQTATEVLKLLESATNDRSSRVSITTSSDGAPISRASLEGARTEIGITGITAADPAADRTGNPDATLGPAATSITTPPARSRTWQFVAGALAVVVLGGGVFAATRGATSSAASGPPSSRPETSSAQSSGAPTVRVTPLVSAPTPLSSTASASPAPTTTAPTSTAPTSTAPTNTPSSATATPSPSPSSSAKPTAHPATTYDPNDVTF
ncbi:MAG: serine/threonine-protein kinase [Polyangiaceae bacterium]